MTSSVDSQSQKSLWSRIVPHIASPLALSIGIFPVYYGFVIKSAQQTGIKIPRPVIKELIHGGACAAPLSGAQVIVQNIIEKQFKKLFGKQGEQSLNFGSSLVSAGVAVVVTAPSLAVLNGWTLNRPWKQSLSSLIASPRLTTALVVRDTSFLCAFKMSEPLSKAMKAHFGNTPTVEYASLFGTGVIAALVGHPADTAFTCWQSQIPISSVRQLARGASARAISVGLLFAGSTAVEKFILSLETKNFSLLK